MLTSLYHSYIPHRAKYVTIVSVTIYRLFIIHIMTQSSYENLTQALEHLSATWNLDRLRPLEPSSFTHNYVGVAYSHQFQADVVIKICPEGIDTERKALEYFQGDTCVKLLAHDTAYHGILLEYVQPATLLKSYFPHDEDYAISIFAEIVKSYIHRPITSTRSFPTTEQWLATLHTHASTMIPRSVLTRAQQMSQELLATQTHVCVLHGDLHHENILQRGDRWIMIDPKGVIGEPEYELAAFLRNPIPQLLEQPHAHEIIQNRIKQFCALFGFDQQRIVRWNFVQAILAACWAEQNGRPISKDGYYLRLATLIENMID
jgi:streptomycin 6-kinase